MATDKQDEADACHRSRCPMACVLDLIGDKWTLLVVRDLFFGKRLFKELQDSMENIPSNILADRLKKLEAAGIVAKDAYQERPVRYAYRLTDKGMDLKPVMLSLAEWSNKYIPGTLKVDASKLPK
jgi:DNA-binding HxlR family transcriptional regulator